MCSNDATIAKMHTGNRMKPVYKVQNKSQCTCLHKIYKFRLATLIYVYFHKAVKVMTSHSHKFSNTDRFQGIL